MKLTAVLIMPVNTKDRHRASSRKDEVHLVKDLAYNFLGKLQMSPSPKEGPITTTHVTIVHCFSECLPSLRRFQTDLGVIPLGERG